MSGSSSPQPSRYQKLTAGAKTRIREITIADLEAKTLEAPPLVIDVRDAHEFVAGHIPGALHISRGTLEGSIEEAVPNLNTPIVLVCAGGNRSALAADSLQTTGYTSVSSLIGGFNAWQKAGKSVEDPSSTTDRG